MEDVRWKRNGNGSVDFGDGWDAERRADGFCGFLAGGDDGTEVRQSRKQGRDICRLYNLEELVGGIVLQAADGSGGIEESKALFLAEGHNLINLETLGFEVYEVILVAKEYLALDAPVVVDEVRVIEIHAPTLTLRRETAEEEYAGILGQEGTQRMVLYPTLAAGDILRVQIGSHCFIQYCRSDSGIFSMA